VGEGVVGGTVKAIGPLYGDRSRVRASLRASLRCRCSSDMSCSSCCSWCCSKEALRANLEQISKLVSIMRGGRRVSVPTSDDSATGRKRIACRACVIAGIIAVDDIMQARYYRPLVDVPPPIGILNQRSGPRKCWFREFGHDLRHTVVYTLEFVFRVKE
jgi:hypothetical protein